MTLSWMTLYSEMMTVVALAAKSSAQTLTTRKSGSSKLLTIACKPSSFAMHSSLTLFTFARVTFSIGISYYQPSYFTSCPSPFTFSPHSLTERKTACKKPTFSAYFTTRQGTIQNTKTMESSPRQINSRLLCYRMCRNFSTNA